MRTSRLRSITRGRRRAGWPTRMIGRLAGRRRTMLSTEMFDGPQTRILFGCTGSGDTGGVTSCSISSSRVCVFPVPGGP